MIVLKKLVVLRLSDIVFSSSVKRRLILGKQSGSKRKTQRSTDEVQERSKFVCSNWLIPLRGFCPRLVAAPPWAWTTMRMAGIVNSLLQAHDHEDGWDVYISIKHFDWTGSIKIDYCGLRTDLLGGQRLRRSPRRPVSLSDMTARQWPHRQRMWR